MHFLRGHLPHRSFATGTLVAAVVLTVAACGGGSPGAPTAGSQAQSTAGPASAGVPTTGSIATIQPTGGGGTLTDADDFCLNTPDEVAASLQVQSVTAAGMANPGFGGGCLYSDASGVVVYGISVVVGPSAGSAFQGYKASDGVEEVQGIADGAIYLRVNELLGIAFLKGEVVASMAPGAGLAIHADEAALRAALADLARQAAGRA